MWVKQPCASWCIIRPVLTACSWTSLNAPAWFWGSSCPSLLAPWIGCEGDCTSTYKGLPPAGVCPVVLVTWVAKLRLHHNLDHQQGCVGKTTVRFLVHLYIYNTNLYIYITLYNVGVDRKMNYADGFSSWPCSISWVSPVPRPFR